jgi:hypothetical protein
VSGTNRYLRVAVQGVSPFGVDIVPVMVLPVTFAL